MTKNFLLFIFVGVTLLAVFILFAFGILNTDSTSNKTDNETSRLSATSHLSATEPGKSSEIKIEDIKVGTGPAVKSGDVIDINYVGTLTNGSKFDSSYDRGQPFETQIGVGQVIKGWDLGVIGMKAGGKRKLTIPPSLGYGDQAIGPIPPNSTLIFEVELVKIK